VTVCSWYKVTCVLEQSAAFISKVVNLKTAADSFKTFVHVHLATWVGIPQGSVNILLMPSLVQSLSIYLIVTVANTQYFIALAVLQSCDAVS